MPRRTRTRSSLGGPAPEATPRQAARVRRSQSGVACRRVGRMRLRASRYRSAVDLLTAGAVRRTPRSGHCATLGRKPSNRRQKQRYPDGHRCWISDTSYVPPLLPPPCAIGRVCETRLLRTPEWNPYRQYVIRTALQDRTANIVPSVTLLLQCRSQQLRDGRSTNCALLDLKLTPRGSF